MTGLDHLRRDWPAAAKRQPTRRERSCLIDGETVAVDDHGRRVFDDGFGLKSYTQSTFVW
jgi:hypothetical protein